MDPVSILSIASAAGSLAFKCGAIVQTLHCLRDKYKQAELTILSVIEYCRTIELAWSRIEKWAAHSLDVDGQYELAERLQLSIYSGQLFMAELEKELVSLECTPKYSTLRRRTKIIWNESMFRMHQDRIQRQICALTLLLEVIQLPSNSDRAEMLSIKEPVVRSVEDSVRSIMPTNLSVCSDDASSIRSFESSELLYIPFAFEDVLFTSYVYKRNFRTNRIHRVQAQQKPEVTHPKGRIEGSIDHTETVSRNYETSPELGFSPGLAAAGSSTSFDAALCSEHGAMLSSITESSSDIMFTQHCDNSEHDPSVSANNTIAFDNSLSIADVHYSVSVVGSRAVTEGVVYQGIEIKRGLSSSAKNGQEQLEPVEDMSDPSLTQVLLGHLQTERELKAFPTEQPMSLISQILQSDLESARPNWTSTTLEDQSIANAVAFRDLAKPTGILHRIPTASRLACAIKDLIMIDYLLSPYCPLIPLGWRAHPFILVTRRRYKAILELLVKSASNAVNQLIQNVALTMVVNRARLCSLQNRTVARPKRQRTRWRKCEYRVFLAFQRIVSKLEK